MSRMTGAQVVASYEDAHGVRLVKGHADLIAARLDHSYRITLTDERSTELVTFHDSLPEATSALVNYAVGCRDTTGGVAELMDARTARVTRNNGRVMTWRVEEVAR